MAPNDAKGPSAPAKKKEQGPGSSSSGKKKSPKTPPKASKGKTSPAESQVESVFSGRLVLATALLLAIVLIPISLLGQLITKRSPKTTPGEAWEVGGRATVHITVTSADFEKLACLDKRPAGDAHCAFVEEGRRAVLPKGTPVDDNKAHELQPYRTTDSKLLLMAGLWAQPEVATRLHEEPSRGVPEKRLARFIVSCELEFLEKRAPTVVRWSRSGKWDDQGEAMIARPLSCEVLEKHQDKKGS